jgi:cold shock protein
MRNFIAKIKQALGLSKEPKVNVPMTGYIKFFDKKKGFGFIVSDGRDYFFNVSATRSRDFKFLKDAAEVRFILVQGKRGMQANNVEII